MPTTDLSKRKCIIWDFDGTIADTEGFIVAAATKVLEEWGYTADEMGDVSRIVGPPYPGAFRTVYGVSEAQDAQMTERYFELYDWKNPESHVMYEGLRELMERLVASGKRMAIASSKTKLRLDYCVEDLQLGPLFEAVYSKGDVETGSKPELIRLAMQALGAEPEDCVMIGDRHYDITGAAAVGVPGVGVTYGTHKAEELREAGAAVVCESVAELAGALEG